MERSDRRLNECLSAEWIKSMKSMCTIIRETIQRNSPGLRTLRACDSGQSELMIAHSNNMLQQSEQVHSMLYYVLTFLLCTIDAQFSTLTDLPQRL